MKRIIFLAGLLFSPWLLAASPTDVLRHTLPDGQTVVVAEGAGEPASIGSYSIRLYAPASDPAYALDQFQSGIVAPRDGSLRSIRMLSLHAASPDAVVVVMESSGTGGYLAADAYLAAAGHLTMLACVRGLAPRADLRTALQRAASADVSCAP